MFCETDDSIYGVIELVRFGKGDFDNAKNGKMDYISNMFALRYGL